MTTLELKVFTKDLHLNLPERDTLVFEQANRAYSKVGLVSHPGKQKRFQTQGTILGADFSFSLQKPDHAPHVCYRFDL